MPNLYTLFKDYSERFGLLGSLALCGCFLIIVNVFTQAGVGWWQSRSKDRDRVDEDLKPLLRACADLISRLVELLITHKKSMIDAVSAFRVDALDQRITTLNTADDFNRHETTAYRLINFFALAKYFERQTAGIRSFAKLDRVEYFLQHKVVTGAKGNLFSVPFLSTETQEDMAASYLDSNTSRRAADLTAGCFLAELKGTKYPLVYFKKALEFVGVVPPYAGGALSMDRAAKDWRHVLILAQFAVYLIDFYQECAQDPQWEEHRVFFVRLVKQWNADPAGKARYLYVHGDLETENYLDTFPSKRTSRQSAMFSSSWFKMIVCGAFMLACAAVGVRLQIFSEWAVPACLGFWSVCVVIEAKWRLGSYFCKLLSLNIRGSRFGRRHYPKRVWPSGVVIKAAKRDYPVDWREDLTRVHEDVRAWLSKRLLET